MAKIKGIAVKVMDKYVKFISRSIVFDHNGQIISGTLLEPAKLTTADEFSFYFRDEVRFNPAGKVRKGILAWPQKVEAEDKKLLLKGFRQFPLQEIIRAKKRRLQKMYAQEAVELSESTEVSQLTELFILAQQNYIVRPQLPKIYQNSRKSNLKTYSRYSRA